MVHVRRPSNTSGRRRRRSPIKAVRHAVLVVSVILFASGLLATVGRSLLLHNTLLTNVKLVF